MNMSDGTYARGKKKDPVLIISDRAAVSMCGGDKSLIGPMARAMIRAATLGGEIYAASKDKCIVGYAVWMPPGQDLLSTYVVSPIHPRAAEMHPFVTVPSNES